MTSKKGIFGHFGGKSGDLRNDIKELELNKHNLGSSKEKKCIWQNSLFSIIRPWKSATSAVFAKKTLTSEMLRARAKQTQFLDHSKKKTFLTKSFNFYSCDLEKVLISRFSQKLLELKRRNFLREKMYLMKFVILDHVTKGKKYICKEKHFCCSLP